MDVRLVDAKKPDVVITLSWDEAQVLQNMLHEAKAYASDCGECITSHTDAIEVLAEAMVNQIL